MRTKIYIPLPQDQLKALIERRQAHYKRPNRLFPKIAKGDTLIGGTTILGKAWIAGKRSGLEKCCRYFEYRIVAHGEGFLVEGHFRFTFLDRIFPFLLAGGSVFLGLTRGTLLGDPISRAVLFVLFPVLIFASNGILCVLQRRTKSEKYREQLVMDFLKD